MTGFAINGRTAFTLRDQASLREALRLAEPGDGADTDALPGISAQALEGRPETPARAG